MIEDKLIIADMKKKKENELRMLFDVWWVHSFIV
jgi:hypothetical protein